MRTFILAASMLLAGINLLLALAVVTGRFWVSLLDRRRASMEEDLKPEVLEWLDGSGGTVPRKSIGREVFVALVARYGRALRGADRDQLAIMAKEQGIERTLAKQLRSRRWWHRADAAYRVGDIGCPLVRPLIELLDDRKRHVRNAAARSLGRLGAVAAVQPLVLALSRQRIARAIGAQALLDIGMDATTVLERLLIYPDKSVRAVAAELLGHNEQGSVEALEEAASDPNPAVRVSVVRALGRCGSPTSVEIINRMLDDAVPYVRAAAATAAAALRTGDRLSRLVEMAARDEYVPATAAAAAIAILEPRAIQVAARAPGAPAHLIEAADLARVS